MVSLARGDYGEAIDAVLSWNNQIMAERKAGPWVRVGENGRMDVRYRGAEQLLPPAESLPTLWRNSYFIDTLKGVVRQLGNKA